MLDWQRPCTCNRPCQLACRAGATILRGRDFDRSISPGPMEAAGDEGRAFVDRERSVRGEAGSGDAEHSCDTELVTRSNLAGDDEPLDGDLRQQPPAAVTTQHPCRDQQNGHAERERWSLARWSSHHAATLHLESGPHERTLPIYAFSAHSPSRRSCSSKPQEGDSRSRG
jgi:hypothetical protein